MSIKKEERIARKEIHERLKLSEKEGESARRPRELRSACSILRGIPEEVLVDVNIADDAYTRGNKSGNEKLIEYAISWLNTFEIRGSLLQYYNTAMRTLEKLKHPQVNILEKEAKAYIEEAVKDIGELRDKMERREWSESSEFRVFLSRIFTKNSDFTDELIYACDCETVRKVIVRREREKEEE